MEDVFLSHVLQDTFQRLECFCRSLGHRVECSCYPWMISHSLELSIATFETGVPVTEVMCEEVSQMASVMQYFKVGL